MSKTSISVDVKFTPAMLAAAFWQLDSEAQAEFFQELNHVVQREYAADPKSYAWSLGEMQWLYMGDALEKNDKARDMLMAMAAPLYMHTLLASGGYAP